MTDTTTCPECNADAVVQWRAVLESTDGPIEHEKIHCTQGHWFLLPTAMLAQQGDGLVTQEFVMARTLLT